MPDGVNIPGGPSFVGLPQPPDVPCDPTGDGWRGPQGFPGEPGPPGPPGTTTVVGGVGEAPADGAVYGRQGSTAGWLAALPLTGGTLTGDLAVNGPAGSLRTLGWQTAGSNRWSLGTNTVVESAPVTTIAAAAVPSGNNVIPVLTTAGITSLMQVVVPGVTPTTYVVSAVGTASVSTTATATIAAGSQVIPLANTAGVLAPMLILGVGIAPSSTAQIVGGTTGSVSTTTTTNVQTSFINVAVASVAGIAVGMLATGPGIAADTYVTSVVTGSSVLAVTLSKNRTATIPNGSTLTFFPAVVLSVPTTGSVTNGDTITASPAIVISQNTTGSGVANGATITLYPNTGMPSVLSSFNDAGNLWLIPMTVSRSTGIPNFQQALTIIPVTTQTPNSTASFQPLFFSQASFTGHVRTTGAFVHYNYINITADSSDLGFHGAHGFLLSHTYGGAGFSGGRVAYAINMQQTPGFASAGGAGSGLNNQRIGMNISLSAGENAGGTAPTVGSASGSLYALATYSRLLSGGSFGGATFYNELNGYNLNIEAQAGTSVATKHALNISPLATDAVQGSVMDAAIHLAMQPGAIGWKNLVAIGNMQGSWPLDPTANIWGTYRSHDPRPMQAAYGLNWRDIAFTTAPIAVPGFVVDGGGNVRSGALVVSTTGNTTSIDATLVHVANTVVAASASNTWTAGMGLYDASGNQWLCTATDASDGISAGHMTGVSNIPIGPAFIAAPPPANPVSVTDQSGAQTATLTLTWSTAPALSIQPSGGAIKSALLTNAANDAAAASAGVAVGQWYRNGSVMMQRVA